MLNSSYKNKYVLFRRKTCLISFIGCCIIEKGVQSIETLYRYVVLREFAGWLLLGPAQTFLHYMTFTPTYIFRKSGRSFAKESKSRNKKKVSHIWF